MMREHEVSCNTHSNNCDRLRVCQGNCALASSSSYDLIQQIWITWVITFPEVTVKYSSSKQSKNKEGIWKKPKESLFVSFTKCKEKSIASLTDTTVLWDKCLPGYGHENAWGFKVYQHLSVLEFERNKVSDLIVLNGSSSNLEYWFGIHLYFSIATI